MSRSVYISAIWMFQIEFVVSGAKQNLHHLKHVYTSAKTEFKRLHLSKIK